MKKLYDKIRIPRAGEDDMIISNVKTVTLNSKNFDSLIRKAIKTLKRDSKEYLTVNPFKSFSFSLKPEYTNWKRIH